MKLQLLIVEDDAGDAALMFRRLKAAGLEPEHARGGHARARRDRLRTRRRGEDDRGRMAGLTCDPAVADASRRVVEGGFELSG